MNEFISPHQNININISYNLGQQQKIPKVVFGKKIAKIVKSTIKQQPKIFLKTFKKVQDQNPPSEETKKFKPTKNKTKRKSNNLLTFPDQEEVVPRRLKTQGNSKSQITNSLVRKQPKSQTKSIYRPVNQHSKSVNNPPNYLNKTVQNTKKQPSQILTQKPKKQQRRVSNKSCILYQQKKHIILSDIDHHVASTSIGGAVQPSVNKKRANSANVIRSEKFINRLLDMSVLTSQLGGSIPIKDQNNKNSQNTNNRIKSALQGFMNSIDLRIIKKMQQDNKSKMNILVDYDLGSGMELIQFLNRIRRIPLERLNEKAIIIQRFWRKKLRQNVLPFYRKIFFRNPAINKKMAIESNINQISQINIIQGGSQEDQQAEDMGLPVYSMRRNKNLKIDTIQYNSAIKKNPSQKSSFQQESISAGQVKKMLEHQQISVGQQFSISDRQRNKEYGESRQQQSESFRNMKMNKKRKRAGIYKNINQQDQQLKFDYQDADMEQQSNKNASSLNIQKYKQLVKLSIQQNNQKNKINPNLNLKNMEIRPNSNQRQIKIQEIPDKRFSNNIVEQLRNKINQGHNSPNLILQEEQYKKNNNKQLTNTQLKAQSAHWNYVHNILSSNINKKVPLMPKTVLEQLMKQSAINKQWVQSQFCSESRKISLKQSPRQKQRQINGLVSKLPNIEANKKASQQQSGLPLQKRENYGFSNIKVEKQKQREENSEQYSISSGYQQEDTQKQQYNWNKYSDISKIKKPQQLLPKTKTSQSNRQDITQLNNHKYVNNFLNANVDTKNEQDRLNTLQITEEVKRKQKNSSLDYNHTDNQQYQIPGLMPSGLNNNIIIQEIADQNSNNNNKQLDIEFISERDIALSKDQKWVRKQMTMEDGIVQKYLDCGLDYFGLNLQNNTNSHNLSSEQLQQREVQQKQEHKATLQKQHHKNSDPKNIPSDIKQKDDDIFSNQASNPQQIDDDMQLVYVFNNHANNWNKHVDLEHAVKNSKRKDNVNHLAIRENQQPGEILSENQLSNNSKGTSQQGQLNQGIPAFEPSFNIPPQEGLTKQQMIIQQQINNKRKQKITQYIITKLIEQFAYDVSVILRKSHTEQEYRNSNTHQRLYQQNLRNNGGNIESIANINNNSQIGIQTNFQSIRDFVTKIKQYIINQQEYCVKVIQNLKNNIGPTSMEILSYLRLQQSNQFLNEQQNQNQQQSDNQEWLFVIPNDLFQLFNKKLIEQDEKNKGKKLSNKFKLYSQFWNRSIFQCYNQCLDFQRPYGITGAPYAWVTEPKLPKNIKYSKPKVKQILESAQSRLLQLSCSSSGIIFDKPDSPYRQFNISEEDRVQMNEQKISRMLATQIIDDEYNWITYNDEITQLMVDISRKVQQILIFQLSTDLKKIMRRRRVMAHLNQQKSFDSGEMGENSSEDDQYAVFVVEDLV